jgi:hypothetical protein
MYVIISDYYSTEQGILTVNSTYCLVETYTYNIHNIYIF